MATPSGPDPAFDAPALRPQEWRRRPAAARPSPERPVARQSRAEAVADQLMAMAESALAGDRLGAKEELRLLCGVSVGTFNEAVRIAQSRGVVLVRPGPGGGVFVAAQSPMVRLGNSVLALDASQTSVAEAVRIRDALDPLLIEDALWHASPADIADLRELLADMAAAAAHEEPTAFVHANWCLHARIAAISPHPVLRSLYVNLLEQIESHTLAVLPDGQRPLPDYLRDRHALHEGLVDALAERDRDRALDLIAHHNTGGLPEPSSLGTADLAQVARG